MTSTCNLNYVSKNNLFWIKLLFRRSATTAGSGMTAAPWPRSTGRSSPSSSPSSSSLNTSCSGSASSSTSWCRTSRPPSTSRWSGSASSPKRRCRTRNTFYRSRGLRIRVKLTKIRPSRKNRVRICIRLLEKLPNSGSDLISTSYTYFFTFSSYCCIFHCNFVW